MNGENRGTKLLVFLKIRTRVLKILFHVSQFKSARPPWKSAFAEGVSVSK